MERDSTGHPSRSCECEFKMWSQSGINFLSNYTTGHRSRKAPRVCGPCIPCWEQDPNKTEARVCHTHPCPPQHSCLPSEWHICIRDISVTQSLQSTLGLTSVLHSVGLDKYITKSVHSYESYKTVPLPCPSASCRPRSNGVSSP